MLHTAALEIDCSGSGPKFPMVVIRFRLRLKRMPHANGGTPVFIQVAAARAFEVCPEVRAVGQVEVGTKTVFDPRVGISRVLVSVQYVFNPQNALADLSKLHGGTSIVLGGVAYGEKASSTVEAAKLTLKGGTVEGAIFMGGVAGHGGAAQGKKAELTVDGVDVDTIFAGGAVVNDESADEDNASSGTSVVEEAVINLVSGSAIAVYGDGYKTGATVGKAVVNVHEGFKVGQIEGRSAKCPCTSWAAMRSRRRARAA